MILCPFQLLTNRLFLLFCLIFPFRFVFIYLFLTNTYVLSPSAVPNSLWPHGLCSLPAFSVHGIFQARKLEWVAISYSRGSSQPRDWTHISCIGRRVLYHWASWEALFLKKKKKKEGSIWLVLKSRSPLLLGTFVWNEKRPNGTGGKGIFTYFPRVILGCPNLHTTCIV